jgi:uncharacterized protein (TIGR03435 family)
MRFWGPMSMPQLAESLTKWGDRPVLDTTRLDGFFDIDVKFAPDDIDATKEGPILATLPKALEEQLGLKLVPAKEPVKILVIDHADSVPVDN